MVQFDYQKPYANFNESGVHGKLSTLFRVPEPEKYCAALQVAAGGKLMNVVVSEQNVAKELIQARVLASRVTFMPLNRIQANRLPPAKVNELM